MPTSTFNIAASGDDAYVDKTGSATYPPTTSLTRSSVADSLFVIRAKSVIASTYELANTLLKFDTSSLPDTAIVTSATLRMYLTAKSGTDGLSMVGEWYIWDGTSSTDYSAVPASNAHGGTLLSSLTTSADNDFALSSLVNISNTGNTYLRLHISQLSGDAAPTGRNDLTFASYDHATLTEPRLIVTYSTDVGGDLVGQIGV